MCDVCEYGVNGKPIIDCKRYKQLQAELVESQDIAHKTNLHWEKLFQQLQAENDNLKENLLDFGRHSEGCNYPVNEKYGCKCGWLEIEQALKESEV